MMRIMAISGNHARHFSVFQEINRHFPLAGHLIIKREHMVPTAPIGTSARDKALFDMHFKKRDESEQKYFAKATPPACESLIVGPDELNSDQSVAFTRNINPDMVLIFGSGLVKDKLYQALPPVTVNMHLGLSPRYRGAATLFWPFYFMEPLAAGATFHYIVAEPDAGDVIHQTVPVLDKNDGIHDVGCKTVLQATQDLVQLLQIYQAKGSWKSTKQMSTGKNFLITDFKPHHLRVNYEIFNDQMVEQVLLGNLPSTPPKLIKQF